MINLLRCVAHMFKISRIRDAQACYAWPASTLQPWKLTAHVMRETLSKGANFQTHTTVIRVIASSKNPMSWTVETNRGNIECLQVVHATNAFSSALEPSLRGLISPQPHICDKFIPPTRFIETGGLKNSYGVLLPDGALITINPRNSREQGPMLLGGSNPGQPDFEKWLRNRPDRCIDDDLRGFETITEAAKDFAESQLTGWKPDSDLQVESDIYSWSGIIGLVSHLCGKLDYCPKPNIHEECRQRAICRRIARTTESMDMCRPPRAVSTTGHNFKITGLMLILLKSQWNGSHLHGGTWAS